jgi:hypothetical protein
METRTRTVGIHPTLCVEAILERVRYVNSRKRSRRSGAQGLSQLGGQHRAGPGLVADD